MLVGVISLSKKSYVVIGKILYHLNQDDNWRKSIGSIDTWEDYLRQPEIGLNKGDATRMMQIYELFCIKFGMDEESVGSVPTKNMHYLLPIVKKMDDPEEVQALTADATLLSQQDFKSRIYDKKSEEGEVSETYEYFVMKRRMETNTLHRIKDIPSDVIAQTFGLNEKI